MKSQASILIVDDNVSICMSMSLILRQEGYIVETAMGGVEAIAKTKKMSFDIIFLDIKMPIMNGVETYKAIKKIRAKAIVVMMTAYAVEDLVHEALQEGAYGIIYKPLDPNKVFTLIRRAEELKQGIFILVVDDEPGICIGLKKVLTRKHYHVGIAHTGNEAIAMAQARSYAVIFLDVKLPTINGLETYLAIKNVDPRVVVIMMTGYRQEMATVVQTALDNNAYTCLYKPLDIEEVLRLLDEILEKRAKKNLGIGNEI